MASDYDVTTGRRAWRVLIWTFCFLDGFFILLALPYVDEKPFLGFGSFGGFLIVTMVSIGVAVFVTFCYAVTRFGLKVGTILDAQHQGAIKQQRKR